MELCKCYHTDFPGYAVCWGTREREPCECGGDESKCDFYEEVRQKALAARSRAAGIRNKTDEELAEWIADLTSCTNCPVRGSNLCVGRFSYVSCESNWLKWLKQEATDD